VRRALARARPLVASHGAALLRDSLLAGLGTAATRAFLLALGVLVSRTVRDLEAFGVFSSVLLTVQLIAMFTGLGLAQTASQAIAAASADRARQDRTVRSAVLLVLLTSALVAIALPALSPLLPDGLARTLPRDLVPAATVLLAVQLAASGLEGVLRGLGRFRALCVAGIAASVAGGAFAVPLVRALGVRGGVLAATGFLALQALLLLGPIAARLRGGLLPPRDVLHLLGVTAAPTFLNGLAWNLGMLLPPLLLARSAHGLRELALWNAATQVRTLMSFAAVVVANAAIPRLAAAYGKPAWRGEVRSAVATAMGAAAAMYLPVVLVARPLMGLYGAQYAEHAALLATVASFVLLQVLGSALFVVLLSARRTWQSALLNALWAAAVLALAPRVIASGGAHALALAYLWTYGPVLVVLSLLVVRVLRTAPARRDPRPSGAAAPAQPALALRSGAGR
jgi:O-antigen/teichoic acid export membrane protein